MVARLWLRCWMTFAVVVALLVTTQAGEGSLTARISAAVDAAVLREMEKQQLVGVSIGIIQDREIVYLAGYGLADREAKIPTTIDTVMNWASNSKPMAAVAAMQLVERCRLDLDVDVRRYVPEFPEKDGVITIRQLLCHQSGIPHYENGRIVPTQRAYGCERPFLDPVLALDSFNLSPLIYKPGTKSEYSSYAYVLLSAVVQRASGEDFTQYVCRNIVQPVGMESFQLDLETAGQAHWAKGYTKHANGDVILAPESAHYWKHGAGGFKSNVRDFAKWAQALVRRDLLCRSTYDTMWTIQKTSTGEATAKGLGFTVENDHGLVVSHNGKQTETRTRLEIAPDSGRGVVVLCNSGFAESSALTAAIQQALAEHSKQSP